MRLASSLRPPGWAVVWMMLTGLFACGEPKGPKGSLASGCTGGPLLGCACAVPSQLACNGAAQKLRLICNDGVWAINGTCAANENCNQVDGGCARVLPGCSGQQAGFATCDFGGPPAPPYMDVRKTCGPDLVTATAETCEGICAGGACQAPACGDRKLESGEQCDDGNTTPLDGCEPATASPATARCTPSRVLKVTAGDQHTCALCNGGFVRCWGQNADGELGLGHTRVMADRHPYQTTDSKNGPGIVDLGGAAAIDIDAGPGFTCAILDSGAVRCWGRNDGGQLGLGNITPMPTQVGGEVDLGGQAATTIAAGAYFCWGANESGQLGLGFKSMPPTDYVGGDASTVPGKLETVRVF